MRIQLAILDYLRAVRTASLRNIDRALAFAGVECDLRDIKHALQVLEDNKEITLDADLYSIA